ncbi:MAG: nucleotide exchange factor GrpE [Candidatus Omnitrophota bacterium]|nr:nucleotide exchange factor GrpE [Candidatus Omnitrophota bacterium]
MKDNNSKKNSDIPEIKETITILKTEYEALKAKHDERDSFYDKYVRAHAEFENARKRIEKDKAESLKYANESFVIDFLPIIDSLEISEKHIKEAKDFLAVQEGVDMIHVLIQKFLKDIGVEKIKTAGENFDPNFHEAVETVDANDKEDGAIVEELKPGYTFNGKLLRPASVKIVKKL